MRKSAPIPVQQSNMGRTNQVQPSLSIQQTHYEWPIPPAEEFQRYEMCLPGSADRILSMAESQWKHRQDQEKIVIKESMRINANWQLYGFIILGMMIIWSFILLATGKDASWFTTLAIAIVWSWCLYIYWKKEQNK